MGNRYTDVKTPFLTFTGFLTKIERFFDRVSALLSYRCALNPLPHQTFFTESAPDGVFHQIDRPSNSCVLSRSVGSAAAIGTFRLDARPRPPIRNRMQQSIDRAWNTSPTKQSSRGQWKHDGLPTAMAALSAPR